MSDQADLPDEQMLSLMLADFATATAPTKYEYQRVFRHSLDMIRQMGVV